ncbi:restriction endonuclease [Moorena producens PAL-8-15-08-1]|uniref:Type-2 restriction enzyme n=1 Tax=Moorena producens PAL-8-15-08-1 TaxID=1458985 RepID=A0A1D8TX82_9CYAN|nr:type II restriction endonuclease [Moorena producens]AOX02238.1 restriction endonuclease [Moorena producens PAL-8-15-08-1]
MKFHSVFRENLGCNDPDSVFEYVMATLKPSIVKWDYFVNWNKVSEKVRDIEISLNLLNYLVGKDNLEEEARVLFREHPKLISIIPALLACRPQKFHILTDYQSGEFNYDDFSFNKEENITDEDIDQAILFLKELGFLEQITSRRIKSLTDYFVGVEVGLDTNARKNRAGKAMEDIVEYFVNSICTPHGFQYIPQAKSDGIRSEFGKQLTIKKASKTIDFAINTPKKLVLIETNFYRSGGSKLKATAGEYSEIFLQWKQDGHEFIWITDGVGWLTAKRPLRDTFDKIDYILNLDMVEKGVLEALILDQ